MLAYRPGTEISLEDLDKTPPHLLKAYSPACNKSCDFQGAEESGLVKR